MTRLSAAIAALLLVSFVNPVSAGTDPDLPVPNDAFAPAVRESAIAIARHDYASALPKLRPLAEAGDAHAQLLLGVLYRDGNGVERDATQAITWIRKAADQNDAVAQRTLAVIYVKGQGVAKDETQAAAWFRKAADQGDAKAQTGLAVLYEFGHGVPVDLAQARSLFEKAAEHNDAFAQNRLGAMYHDGTGVPKDYAQALLWYHKAADQGFASAQNSLGLMYQNGEGVAKDPAQAVAWFQKAADQGNPSAQDNLGWMYHLGRGVPKDDAKALDLIRKPAAKGDAYAQNNLGLLYRQGSGVEKDPAIAIDWFRKAAEQGNAEAQTNLGQGYEKGEGVVRDPAIAMQWYEKAIALGNARAKIDLAEMYAKGDGVPKDLAKAASIMGVSMMTPGASVLKDDIVYTVAADGTYTDDETTLVRVNLAQSVQRYAQAYLPYSTSLEDLKVVEAYTINKDGKRIDVTPDKIITQQSPISAAAPSFSDIQIKAVVFPDVAPGAVVAMRVLRTVKRPLFAGQFSMLEHFPVTTEVKDSHLTLIAPASLPLQVEAIGMQGGAVAPGKAGTNTWTWTLKDASQGVMEMGSVDPQDFSPRVAATSFPDYAAAAKAYADGADPKAKVTPNVRALAGQITKGITDPRAKAVAIYNWVSHNIRYVSLTFGLGGVVPHDADTILASRYGDCKDHVVLLQALLAAEGIASSPVLVNATSVYWEPRIAMSPGVFDHCITYIPQWDVFVDSTAEIAPFGVLPPTELGKPAMVARGRDGKPALVRLPTTDPKRDTTRTSMTASMAADGSVTGTSVNVDTGVFELVDRLLAANLPGGQESQVAGTLLAQFGAPGTGTLSLGDARDLGRPYSYTSTFNIAGYANVPGPGSFTVPVGVPGMAGIIGLPRETVIASREHPIACLASHKVEDSSLDLPAGVEVKQLPPAVHLANALGHYDATYSLAGHTIRVHRELLTAPASVLCGPGDYQQMRALGAAVSRDFRAQVVY